MRTYRLVIAYDGTAYQGWQRQANTEMTIQGILESCISKAAGYAVEVNGSGRTDAGVHARGQTASVVLHGKAEDGFFTEKVNKLLPPDIRIREAGLEKNGFHARKSAVGKRYVYQIDTDEKPDVFDRRYTYHFPKKLDIAAMVRILTGTLLEVGMGTRRIESVTIALEAKDRTKAGFLAPARGLFLDEVYYKEKSWKEE